MVDVDVKKNLQYVRLAHRLTGCFAGPLHGLTPKHYIHFEPWYQSYVIWYAWCHTYSGNITDRQISTAVNHSFMITQFPSNVSSYDISLLFAVCICFFPLFIQLRLSILYIYLCVCVCARARVLACVRACGWVRYVISYANLNHIQF